MCKAEWTKTLLCCISNTHDYYGKETTSEKWMLSEKKDFSTTALNLEQSNADVRRKNIFHCESDALAKSGKIWIFFLFIIESQKM